MGALVQVILAPRMTAAKSHFRLCTKSSQRPGASLWPQAVTGL